MQRCRVRARTYKCTQTHTFVTQRSLQNRTRGRQKAYLHKQSLVIPPPSCISEKKMVSVYLFIYFLSQTSSDQTVHWFCLSGPRLPGTGKCFKRALWPAQIFISGDWFLFRSSSSAASYFSVCACVTRSSPSSGRVMWWARWIKSPPTSLGNLKQESHFGFSHEHKYWLPKVLVCCSL